MNSIAIEEQSPLEIVGATLKGRVNTSDAHLLENIRHSIRLQHPQARPEPP